MPSYTASTLWRAHRAVSGAGSSSLELLIVLFSAPTGFIGSRVPHLLVTSKVHTHSWLFDITEMCYSFRLEQGMPPFRQPFLM